jgi:hypothetical protein
MTLEPTSPFYCALNREDEEPDSEHRRKPRRRQDGAATLPRPCVDEYLDAVQEKLARHEDDIVDDGLSDEPRADLRRQASDDYTATPT